MSEVLLAIRVEDYLFEFTSFQNWCDTWERNFASSERTVETVICIDARGRVCNGMNGQHFMRASADKAYPVRVYAI